jgi:hypothetical protein
MHSIVSIEPQATDNELRFRVTMTDGTATVICSVDAANLQAYPRFQRAILAKMGVLFRDDTFALPRLGAGYWLDEIERHLPRLGEVRT